MPTSSFRIPDDLYSRMKDTAATQNMTLTDIVLRGVTRWLDTENNSQYDVLQETVTLLREQLHSVQAQLSQKDAQISELHQLVAMAQTNLSDVTKQLEDKRRTWWQRVIGR